MSSTKKLKVFAWIADAKQAQGVTEEMIEDFRSNLGGSLAVERRQNGSLALYTSDPTTKARLDALVRFLGLFHERKIDVVTEDN